MTDGSGNFSRSFCGECVAEFISARLRYDDICGFDVARTNVNVPCISIYTSSFVFIY